MILPSVRGLLLLVSLAVACSSTTPAPSGSNAGSAEASVAPSAGASLVPTPVAQLAPDHVAQVVTTDLAMRSAPGGGPESQVYPGVLDQETLLFIVDGPVTASDYVWYLVYPFATAFPENRPEHWRLAWVAAGSRDGEPWIAPISLTCPPADFDSLTGNAPAGWLACYGNQTLTVRGSFEGFGSIMPGGGTPSWLMNAVYTLRSPATPPDALTVPLFHFHVPGETAQPPSLSYPIGTSIQVVGHFDDPAAETCVAGPLPYPPGTEPTPAPAADALLAQQATVLLCRWQFVATDWSVL